MSCWDRHGSPIAYTWNRCARCGIVAYGGLRGARGRVQGCRGWISGQAPSDARVVGPLGGGRRTASLEAFKLKVKDVIEDRRTSIPGIDIRPSLGWIYVYPWDGRTSNFFNSREVRGEGFAGRGEMSLSEGGRLSLIAPLPQAKRPRASRRVEGGDNYFYGRWRLKTCYTFLSGSLDAAHPSYDGDLLHLQVMDFLCTG